MFFFNARLRFKVPPTGAPIPGSIVAASAISPVDLQKRRFGQHAHLAQRLLDPQLYMASVDPALDGETVAKLAAYPWFHGGAVPRYDSGLHKNRMAWKATHRAKLISMWNRTVPTETVEVRKSARAAVEYQQQAGWKGIILPGPLTTIADQTLQSELAWIDAGLDACAALQIKEPVFATIAISEALLHVDPLKNPLLHSLSNTVAARPELAGAYVVLEQSDPGSYFWTEKDPLASLLTIVDDLYRGAQKRVIVNYVGTFGLVARAVGAEIWASGYYLMQRRFSLRAQGGRAHPRYHSLALAGDVGLKEDIGAIYRAGLADRVMTPTDADAVLRKALREGRKPEDVPQWKYSQSNCSAAQEHYLRVVSDTGARLDKMSDAERQEWVGNWLRDSVALVRVLKQKNVAGPATDTRHQQVWLDVFQWWRDYAEQ